MGLKGVTASPFIDEVRYSLLPRAGHTTLRTLIQVWILLLGSGPPPLAQATFRPEKCLRAPRTIEDKGGTVRVDSELTLSSQE